MRYGVYNGVIVRIHTRNKYMRSEFLMNVIGHVSELDVNLLLVYNLGDLVLSRFLEVLSDFCVRFPTASTDGQTVLFNSLILIVRQYSLTTNKC